MATKDNFHEYENTGFYWYPHRTKAYIKNQIKQIEAITPFGIYKQAHMWQALPYFDAASAAAWYTVKLEYEILFDIDLVHYIKHAMEPHFDDFLCGITHRINSKDFGTIAAWRNHGPDVYLSSAGNINRSWFFQQWARLQEYAKQTPAKESIILNHAEALPIILADIKTGLHDAILDLPRWTMRALETVSPNASWSNFRWVLAECAKRAPRPGDAIEAPAAQAVGHADAADGPADEPDAKPDGLTISDVWNNWHELPGTNGLRRPHKETIRTKILKNVKILYKGAGPHGGIYDRVQTLKAIANYCKSK